MRLHGIPARLREGTTTTRPEAAPDGFSAESTAASDEAVARSRTGAMGDPGATPARARRSRRSRVTRVTTSATAPTRTTSVAVALTTTW